MTFCGVLSLRSPPFFLPSFPPPMPACSPLLLPLPAMPSSSFTCHHRRCCGPPPSPPPPPLRHHFTPHSLAWSSPFVSATLASLLLCSLLPSPSNAQTSAPLSTESSDFTTSSSSPLESSSSTPPAIIGSDRGIEGYLWARIIGGIFSLIAILISSLHIRAHLRHNHDSQLRRYVVRILWMVPLYAAVGWMGLMMRKYTLYFDVARDVYESVVIWSFFQFCLVYLGGSVVLNEQLSRRAQIGHSWPFHWCLRPWSMEHRFLFHTRLGVTQYVVIKSLMAIITFSLAAADEYRDGQWSFHSPYTYITIINNFSQGYALYALFLFYHATKVDLDRIRPIAKFLCVKLIIFATYWQSVLISVLALAGRFEGWEGWTSENVGQGLQDFLICIEMCIASFGHIYAFPSKEFWTVDGGDEETRSGSAISKVFDVMTPSDIVSDVRELTRMNKYQQVHNENEEWGQHDQEDLDALTPSSNVNSANHSSSSFSSHLGVDHLTGARKKRKKRKEGAANGDKEGQFTPDEAGKSYSLVGIEERVKRVKEELFEQNRLRMEARKHMRASYNEQKGEERADELADTTLELHVTEDGEGGGIGEGAEEQKSQGTQSPTMSERDGESSQVNDTDALVNDVERGEEGEDDRSHR